MKRLNLETESWEGEEETRALNSLEFLQSVYRDDEQPLATRIRCAVESLPYETPKLMAVAHINGNFADQLDKAIEQRSRKTLLIEAVPLQGPQPGELSAGGLKKAKSKLRRF